MQQFIPFEDDWDALQNLRPEDLIPYRIELLPQPASTPGTSAPTGFPGTCGHPASVPSNSPRLPHRPLELLASRPV